MNHCEAVPGGAASTIARARARHAEGFELQGAGTPLRAAGVRHALAAGPARTLEARARAFFADPKRGRPEGGPDVLVGALPFDTDRDVLCFQPESVAWGGSAELAKALGAPLPPGVDLRITGAPDAATYARTVERALARIAGAPLHEGRGLRKIVLARSLHVDAAAPIDTGALVRRLARDASVTTFLVDLSPATGHPGHRMIGATPELLVSRRGLRVASHPLAGSAARVRDVTDDRRAGEALLRSEKDLREHAVVVESILDVLSPLCSRLSTPDGVGLRSTATMWHLGTRIEGTLKGDDGPTAAGLAALLHPTPAVGGDPRDAALAAIRELESHDRGFYAGTIGWTDARGDGEWYVALRCAEVRSLDDASLDGGSAPGEALATRVTLHAGAGIVAGSDPEREVAETSAKFQTMLHALGIDELGNLRRGSPLSELPPPLALGGTS